MKGKFIFLLLILGFFLSSCQDDKATSTDYYSSNNLFKTSLREVKKSNDSYDFFLRENSHITAEDYLVMKSSVFVNENKTKIKSLNSNVSIFIESFSDGKVYEITEKSYTKEDLNILFKSFQNPVFKNLLHLTTKMEFAEYTSFKNGMEVIFNHNKRNHENVLKFFIAISNAENQKENLDDLHLFLEMIEDLGKIEDPFSETGYRNSSNLISITKEFIQIIEKYTPYISY